LEVEVWMTREKIIEQMCYTYRHDYGLIISEDDKMYTLTSGVTERERESIRKCMSQIFDNVIAPNMEFKNENLSNRWSWTDRS
jgi:hypothetical protein